MSEAPEGFEDIKSRLDQIVDAVSAEGISLDDALALYEEAIKLGLEACNVSEADILLAEDESPQADEDREADRADMAETSENAKDEASAYPSQDRAF